jgi:hypothetical protein
VSDSPKTYDDLHAKHSWLFVRSPQPGPRWPIEFGHGFECEGGWMELLDEALTRIGEVVIRAPEAQRVRCNIYCVKEKFGGLRIHADDEDAEIEAIIAEATSRHTHLRDMRRCRHTHGIQLVVADAVPGARRRARKAHRRRRHRSHAQRR